MFPKSYVFPIHPTEMMHQSPPNLSAATRQTRVFMIESLNAYIQKFDQSEIDNKTYVMIDKKGDITGFCSGPLFDIHCDRDFDFYPIFTHMLKAENWITMNYNRYV